MVSTHGLHKPESPAQNPHSTTAQHLITHLRFPWPRGEGAVVSVSGLVLEIFSNIVATIKRAGVI